MPTVDRYTRPSEPPESGEVTPLARTSPSGKLIVEVPGLLSAAGVRDTKPACVCPATADLLAKMAAGIADDLATTLLLATDKPVVVVPAMNVRMWLHAATQRNVAQLKADGVRVIEPAEGEMACGEFGPGRLPEPQDILDQVSDLLK